MSTKHQCVRTIHYEKSCSVLTCHSRNSISGLPWLLIEIRKASKYGLADLPLHCYTAISRPNSVPHTGRVVKWDLRPVRNLKAD